MRAYVVKPHRLLEPGNIERLRARAKSLTSRQIPSAVGVDGDRDARPDRRANRFDALDVDHRIVMADLQLQAAEAVMLYRPFALGHEVVLCDREPADVGIVRFELFLGRAAKQFPERQARGLGAQIPERNVDRSEREMSNAGP